MRSEQRVYLEQTCHIELGFSYEAYCLSAGRDVEAQSSIAAGEE